MARPFFLGVRNHQCFVRGRLFENVVRTGDANKGPPLPCQAANDLAAAGQHESLYKSCDLGSNAGPTGLSEPFTKHTVSAQPEMIAYLFFAGFFAGGLLAAAGSSLCSGIFMTVMICTWLLAGGFGRAGSRKWSSPSPTDCRRFDAILKVLTRMSRIASARRWLRI